MDERVDVLFQAQTSKAVCVKEDEDSDDVWLPKSLIRMFPEDPDRGDAVKVYAPDWLLAREGLI